jgi:CRISPR-associated endoribonuclease Cas6
MSPTATKSSPLKLGWATNTELVGLQLELEPLQACTIYQRYMVGLHAWFLEQVENLNPELSSYLHDGGAEKPFALSNLEGSLIPIKDQFQIQLGETYYWSIYAFSQPVVQCLANWLTQRPSLLEFRDASFHIKGMRLSQPPTTYKKLLRSRELKPGFIQLNFLSPTSFRSKGHAFPFPLPRSVFQSYLRRWNDFSQLPYEIEFLDWIEDNVHIYDYQLAAQKIAVAKQGVLTSFTGSLTYEIKRTAREDLEAIQLLQALLHLAAYCGTGYKTTFGLGRTAVKCLSSPPEPLLSTSPELPSPPSEQSQPLPAPSEPVPAIQEIDALTQQLMARRKRQGGTRSLTAARTEAEIIVRHQAGESLRAIAQKMGKTYDAVKKAYKRAQESFPEHARR